MNSVYDFSGNVAFVTGAAMGMELATAQAFARHPFIGRSGNADKVAS